MPQTMEPDKAKHWRERRHEPVKPLCYCISDNEPVNMQCRGHGLLADGRKMRYWYCPECGRSQKEVIRRND